MGAVVVGGLHPSLGVFTPAHAPLRAVLEELPVVPHLPEDPRLVGVALGHPAGVLLTRVEAEVDQARREPPPDPQHPAGLQQRPSGVRYVHERHAGHDQVEGAVRKGAKTGRVRQMVFGALWILGLPPAGVEDHAFRGVHGGDLGAAARHAPGEAAVAAGDLQDAQSLHVPDHPLEGGLYEQAVPGIALLALLLVPPIRHPVPHLRVRGAAGPRVVGSSLASHPTLPSLGR